MKKEQGTPDFVNLEKDILKFWDENHSFDKLVKKNAQNTCIIQILRVLTPQIKITKKP